MNISLKEAVPNELDLIMAWRNNPLIYEQFHIQNEPLVWAEHLRWWLQTYNKRVFIIHTETRRIGIVSFRHLESPQPQVDIYIGEVTLWGLGMGKMALSLGMAWLTREGYKACYATILKDNTAGIKLFESVGFSPNGQASEGELRYEWFK